MVIFLSVCADPLPKSCHVREFLQNMLSVKLKFLKYFQINTETEEKDLN